MNTLELKHSNNDTCPPDTKVESDPGKRRFIINPPPEDKRCQCCGGLDNLIS